MHRVQQVRVHQVWGLCPADATSPVPDRLLQKSKTWQRPDVLYTLWNRPMIETLLKTTPWYDTFVSFGHWVEQCDFARYVLVYTYGGIYADLDTTCKDLPIPNDNEVLVGVEADVSDSERAFHGLARPLQLCQWTFAASKEHPALLALIEYIVNVSSKRCITDKSTSTIMNTTGPGVFTDVLKDFPGVSILGIEAFGCGQKHSNSPDCTHTGVYAIHHFEGSWKTPSFFRPLYKFLKHL